MAAGHGPVLREGTGLQGRGHDIRGRVACFVTSLFSDLVLTSQTYECPFREVLCALHQHSCLVSLGASSMPTCGAAVCLRRLALFPVCPSANFPVGVLAVLRPTWLTAGCC